MEEEKKKPIISFYEYLKGMKKYDFRKPLLKETVYDPNFPWSPSKNQMYEYLINKDDDSSSSSSSSVKDQNMLEDFERLWDDYIDSGQADKESRKTDWIESCEEEKKKPTVCFQTMPRW
jgi:hypothetical protein